MHCLTLSEALRIEQEYQPQGLCGKQVQQSSQSQVFFSVALGVCVGKFC